VNYTIVLVLTNVTDYNFTVEQNTIDWTETQNLTPYSGIAQDFTLDHLDYYNQTFDFNVSAEGDWKLQFLLYIDGQEMTQDSYREVHLWLVVSTVE
ncbi:MAG: DUF1616 domain-containing protein, partial [Thermoplasmata archaeon]|nr:DUF1616 domain-containing protein [Thermoplasmata archaeon]